MTKVLIINGPNLNLLGQRENHIYGNVTLEAINNNLKKVASKNKISVEFFQSNEEGSIINFIQEKGIKADYLIINPGAFTHYSIAIRDAIVAVKIKAIEVHLSNIYNREDFRHNSVIAPVAIGQISGLGPNSYYTALDYIIKTCQNV